MEFQIRRFSCVNTLVKNLLSTYFCFVSLCDIKSNEIDINITKNPYNYKKLQFRIGRNNSEHVEYNFEHDRLDFGALLKSTMGNLKSIIGSSL